MFLICFKIFFARIIDVSLGTIRTVLVVKSRKITPAIIAFFEVFIWFIVARQALNTSLDSIMIPIFYSLGYATGTYIGGFISSTFVNGLITIQVITKHKLSIKMVKEIRNKGFGVSSISLNNSQDEIKKDLLIIELNKKKLKTLTKIIRTIDKNAFVIVNDTRYAQNGIV